MNTPIAFIIFKRPDTTQKVFEAIRKAKPIKLFIIADGPREGNLNEVEKCRLTRSVVQQVDWECEVYKNYSDINLGCGKRISSGLNWVFEQVVEAIILEDDCLPHPTFFPFCENLLEKYRHDERIASISGQNVQLNNRITNDSYYFSRYNHIWGWATWRRAWQYFDKEMKTWEQVKNTGFLNNVLSNKDAARIWYQVFQHTYSTNRNIWGYQWQFACWLYSGLGIVSSQNLISNIGFSSEATNVSTKNSKHAELPTQALEFPLQHPLGIICNTEADEFTQKTLFSHLSPNLIQRFILKMQSYLK